MNKKIHLLIPMSGQGTRFQKAGYQEPKPLIPVSGTPMIERLLSNFPTHWDCHFVLAENHRNSGLIEVLKRLRPTATVDFVSPHAQGPGLAIEKGLTQIPPNDAVFVSYCDYAMIWDHAQFERFVNATQCDACLVSYKGFHAHYLSPVPYAYSRLDGERVVEVREKGSFTQDRENEFASAGGYYFGSAKTLKDALGYQVKNNLRLNGELYTSLTVQALLMSNATAEVRVFEIPGFFQWGTPEDLMQFQYWEKTFDAANRNSAPLERVEQVLIPMAGQGSRFQHLTKLKKPMIPVDGVPMFQAALNTLPPAKSKTVLVALDEFSTELTKNSSAQVVSLAQTPPGQALSVEAGLGALDHKKDVLISASDHGIVLDRNQWSQFLQSPDADAAIFTIQGFPGAARRPEAYAYVVPQKTDSSHPSPLVERVSVKKPVSANPSQDYLLVGTFWFRTGEILNTAIQELKNRNIRVNGELYLDSVFELLMAMGQRVRMIPLEGYINWGDPDSLAEALYWKEVFMGRKIDKRPRFPGLKSNL